MHRNLKTAKVTKKINNKFDNKYDIICDGTNNNTCYHQMPLLTRHVISNYIGKLENGLFHDENAEVKFYGDTNYKGSFKAGIMNGVGKYMWPDGIVYEGTFENNKITGHGNYSWPNGSFYHGDVLNGLRHGNGTLYTVSGKRYNGFWVNGKRCGNGLMDYDFKNVSYYLGEWNDNKRHGWGFRRYKSGCIYEGDWWNDKRHGYGKLTWPNDEYYSGEFENGVQNGHGKFVWIHSNSLIDPNEEADFIYLTNIYIGNWVNAKRDGFGTFLYANGSRYEGFWKNNLKEGKGKFIFKNGRVYEGSFENDRIAKYPDLTVEIGWRNLPTRSPTEDEMNLSVFLADGRNMSLEFSQFDNATKNLILRYLDKLRKIYVFYMNLGLESQPIRANVANSMIKLQFWRFLKDCRILNEIDLCRNKWLLNENGGLFMNANRPILFREFLEYLVRIAKLKEIPDDPLNNLSDCTNNLLKNVMKHACLVGGCVFSDPMRTWHIMKYKDELHSLFLKITDNKSFTARQFLYLFKDMGFFSTEERFTVSEFIQILLSDNFCMKNPNEEVNMEVQISFLDFFEAVVAFSEIYVTATTIEKYSPRNSSPLLMRNSRDNSSSISLKRSIFNNIKNSLLEKSCTSRYCSGQFQSSSITKFYSDHHYFSMDEYTGYNNNNKNSKTNKKTKSKKSKSKSKSGKHKRKITIQLPAEKEVTSTEYIRSRSTINVDGEQLINIEYLSPPNKLSIDSRQLNVKFSSILNSERDERQHRFWIEQLDVWFTYILIPSLKKEVLIRQRIQNK